MDQEDLVYVYSGRAFSQEEEEILPFPTTWMDPEGTMLSEIESDGERQVLYDLTHMESKKAELSQSGEW